ncbi:MAG: hypothetical protein AB7P76_09825 [Candidatus Melainabacteria bacterium]
MHVRLMLANALLLMLMGSAFADTRDFTATYSSKENTMDHHIVTGRQGGSGYGGLLNMSGGAADLITELYSGSPTPIMNIRDQGDHTSENIYRYYAWLQEHSE